MTEARTELRKRRFSPLAQVEIDRLYDEGARSPAEIHAALMNAAANGRVVQPATIQRRTFRNMRAGSISVDDVPSLKTIGRMIKELDDLAGADTAEPWQLVAGDENAALIVPVLAELIDSGLVGAIPGTRRPLSAGVAHWIAQVRRVAPDLEPRATYLVATAFAIPGDHASLTAFLSYAPWRGDTRRTRYLNAFETGKITTLHAGFVDLEPELTDVLNRMAASADQGAGDRNRRWPPTGTKGEMQ